MGFANSAMLAAVLLLPGMAGTAARNDYWDELKEGDPRLASLKPERHNQDFTRIGDYSIQIYEPKRTSKEPFKADIAIIRHKGKPVYAIRDFMLGIGGKNGFDEPLWKGNLRPGKDMDGNGVPDLIIEGYGGGAHCCTTIHLFELGKKLKKLATLDLSESVYYTVKDFRSGKRKRPVILAYDSSSDYRWYCHAESCFPPIILEFRGGAFRLATDLMKKPAPSPAQLKDFARRNRGGCGGGMDNTVVVAPPSRITCRMMDLTYSGNLKSAEKLLDLAWPAGSSGKAAFLRDFRKALSESPYWPQILELNGLSSLLPSLRQRVKNLLPSGK